MVISTSRSLVCREENCNGSVRDCLVEDQIEREEEGQGLVEYALILVLVSIAAIVTLTTLGSKLSPIFAQISGATLGGKTWRVPGR